MDDRNKLIEKLGELSAKAYMFGRMYHIDEVTELTKDINELIAKVFDYSPWHTGTPTEEGWYLVAYECIHECRNKGKLEYFTMHILEDEFGYKEIRGRASDDVWKAVAWMPIEPYKED